LTCRKQKEDDFTPDPIAMVKCDFHHKICLETQIVPLVLGATTPRPPISVGQGNVEIEMIIENPWIWAYLKEIHHSIK
jgi:hypothetical protein